MKTGVLGAALLLSSICFAQQVSIRVVSSSDGKPLLGWKVNVFFVDPSQGKDAVKGSQYFQTDANGMVQLTLPQPIPERLDVYAFPQTDKWYASAIRGDTATVMQKGTQSKGISSHGNVSANPGEILILARRITVWDKITRTIFGPLLRE